MSKKRIAGRRKFISSSLVVVLGVMESCSIISKSAAVKNVGIIKGTVLGGSNIFIPYSQVQLLTVSTKKSILVTTDYYGKFKFSELELGNYEVSVVSMDGFSSVAIQVIDKRVHDINLSIKKIGLSSEFSKPAAITMDQLKGLVSTGVSVAEVSDYVYGNYGGELIYPPNADGNPKRAYIIYWKDFSHRFIFAHECSYCPMIEMPSGAGVSYQFFEGNLGQAELFNTPGRRDRSTFVEIMESGPDRVWVRWIYMGVNLKSGEPYYRGVEDFWAYPNGMVMRKQSYTSLRNDMLGHAREPIEFIGMNPVGKTWVDILKMDDHTQEHHALTVLDAFSPNRYDVFWKRKLGTLYDAEPRREGVAWKELDDAAGIAFVMPMKDGSPFCVFGDASGFRHDYTRIKEHSHTDAGGIGWIGQCWDHWPIGWLNSQGHEVDANSLLQYPNHYSPAGMDFYALDNEEAEKGVYYSLIGVGGADVEAIRKVARQWLDKGSMIIGNAKMNSAADLPSLN